MSTVLSDVFPPESLLRILASPHQGHRILGFGRGSLPLLQLFSHEASKAILVERPGHLLEPPLLGIETLITDDWNTPPLSAGSVDLVVLPPPQAWPMHPRARQRWLTTVRRLLSGDGELLLAAPNRHSYSYLRERLAGRRPELAWSLSGYRRALRKAGFDHLESYALERDISRLVVRITPLGAVQPRWLVPTPKRIKDKIKHKFGLTSELLVRAAPLASGSVIQRLCERLSEQLPTSGTPLRINRLFASAKGKVFLVLRSATSSWVVRIPLTAVAKSTANRHKTMLRGLRNRVGAVPWLPTVVESGEVGGVYYQAEQVVAGRAVRLELASARQTNILAELEGVLLQLNPHLMTQASTVLDGVLYRKMVDEPLDRVFAGLEEQGLRCRISAFFEHHLRGMSFVPGITHGDLSLSNIFVRAGRISGIIDWDDARDPSVPVLDAINHLISSELYRARPASYPQALYRLAFGSWPSSEERVFLEHVYRFSRVDTRHHPGLVYLNWLYTADARLAENSEPNPALFRRFVVAVVDLLSGSGQLETSSLETSHEASPGRHS